MSIKLHNYYIHRKGLQRLSQWDLDPMRELARSK